MFGVKNEFDTADQAATYFAGVADGVRMFAWWRDGTQLAGTTGTTLAEAIDQLDAERQRVITALVTVQPEDQATPETRHYHKGDDEGAKEPGKKPKKDKEK